MKLLKFYADWCGPCKQQTKVLEQLDLDIVQSINVDDEESEVLVDKYNIKGLPTLILLNNEEEILERITGFTPLEIIKEKINKYEQSTNL